MSRILSVFCIAQLLEDDIIYNFEEQRYLMLSLPYLYFGSKATIVCFCVCRKLQRKKLQDTKNSNSCIEIYILFIHFDRLFFRLSIKCFRMQKYLIIQVNKKKNSFIYLDWTPLNLRCVINSAFCGVKRNGFHSEFLIRSCPFFLDYVS